MEFGENLKAEVDIMSQKGSWMDIEPHVEELSGILEIPLTGFVLQPRGGTIRMLGFILRGHVPSAIAENTVIIHFPKFEIGRASCRERV